MALLLRRQNDLAADFGWQKEVKRPSARHAAAFGAAVVVAVGALRLARAGAAIQHYPGFTQLWLVDQGRNPATANLGFGNHEGRTMRYRLILLRSGHRIARWGLTLANGQTWRQSPVFSGRYTIEANLYRLPDLSHPYRHVPPDRAGVSNS
jgi:hypothetical protein